MSIARNIVENIQMNQRISESAVGAFYIIGDNIISNHVPVTQGDSYGDYVNYSSHWDLWKLICKKYPVLKRLNYDDFPRGRVVFNKVARQFVIYLDKKLNNPTHINKICHTYHIGTNYKVDDTDEHYKSKNYNLHLHEDMIVEGHLSQYVRCDTI